MQEFTPMLPCEFPAGKLPIEAQGKFDARREKGDGKAPHFGGEGLGGNRRLVEGGLCYTWNLRMNLGIILENPWNWRYLRHLRMNLDIYKC